MSDYNGWTNWETWNTNLWLNNDESTYYEARRICRRLVSSPFDQSTQLKQLAKEIIPSSEGINFNEVNWQEIINSFQEE
jgi:hypothetical protein